MTGLTIHRLGAEVPGAAGPAIVDRVDRLVHRLATDTLHDRRAGMHGLAGDWCVRLLDLRVDLDPAEPDASALARWADLIATSVRTLVPDGSLVIHYPNRSRALSDLVASLIAGRSGRAWAWRQIGLLTSDDPDPAAEPGAALGAALCREPGLAVSVLARAAVRYGVASLTLLLAERGWIAVAAAVSRAYGGPLPQPQPGPPGSPQWRARAQAIVAGSAFAQACLRSPGRPSSALVGAWAAISAAEVEPGRPAVIPAAAGELHRLMTRSAEPPGRPDGHGRTGPTGHPIAAGHPAAAARPADALDGSGSADPVPAGPPERSVERLPAGRSPVLERAGLSPRPEPADAADREPLAEQLDAEQTGGETGWAALLFLLNTAGPAGIPGIADDRRLAARPFRWCMHQLALRLVPIRADDPAAMAMAGLGPSGPGPDGLPPAETEEAALAEYAATWTAVTGQVLEQARPDDETAVPTLWALARRPGRIVADPGWLEVHLDLADVRLDVRRAGLDLDPGWLDWLGVVVRFRYV